MSLIRNLECAKHSLPTMRVVLSYSMIQYTANMRFTLGESEHYAKSMETVLNPSFRTLPLESHLPIQ